MSIKTFLMKKMIMSKMKGVPEAEVDRMIEMINKNPDFFEKIAKEIEQKKKSGVSEQAAAMEVMRKYQGDFQKLMK